MLTMVEIFNERGENLALPLETTSSGYLVKSIDGLDPVKANISSSPFGQLDGEVLQGTRRGSRNIVMELGLETDHVTNTVRELRTKLYDYLMPESLVRLRFYMDGVAFVDISGIVESLESPLFAQSPGAVASVLCHRPDFAAIEPKIFTGATVTGSTTAQIVYEGTVETGTVLRLPINRAVSSLTIVNSPVNGDQQNFEVVAPLVAGDVLEISSVPSDKWIRLTRNGTTTSLLYAVPATSKWMRLNRGVNSIRVTTAGAAMPYTITYTPKFGGL